MAGVEWIETSVWSYLWERSSSKSKKMGLQDVSGVSGTDQRQKAEIEVAETKMLRLSLGVMRIKNKHIKGRVTVGLLGDKSKRRNCDGLDA